MAPDDMAHHSMALPGPTQFDLEPGNVLHERFEVLHSLRQNGMCRTFEVRDRRDGAKRELLVFFAALFESPQQSADFAGEMRSWAEIDSPAVTKVLEVIPCDDGALLVVTAPAIGTTLRERLKEKGSLGAAEAKALGLELLEGLAAIHARALVHGDVKPFTIHVHAKHARLVDGGITPGLWTAKHLGDRTMLIGTPVYAPVEQFGGESPDVQSDLYNLATVLYECVTGVVPWPGKNFLEVFQAKMSAPPAMRTRARKIEVPAALEEVVLRGLQPDRRERYESAEEFRAALANV